MCEGGGADVAGGEGLGPQPGEGHEPTGGRATGAGQTGAGHGPGYGGGEEAAAGMPGSGQDVTLGGTRAADSEAATRADIMDPRSFGYEKGWGWTGFSKTGAKTGSALGGFFGPIGTVAGGLLGGVLGGFDPQAGGSVVSRDAGGPTPSGRGLGSDTAAADTGADRAPGPGLPGSSSSEGLPGTPTPTEGLPGLPSAPSAPTALGATTAASLAQLRAQYADLVARFPALRHLLQEPMRAAGVVE